MIVAAFDPGIANAGYAAIDVETAALVDVDVFTSARDADRAGDTQARLGDMMRWADARLAAARAHGISAIVVEWPMASGRRAGEERASNTLALTQVFAAAGALLGMLRYAAPLMYSPIPPSWRAAVRRRRDLPGRTTTDELHDDLDRQYGVRARIGKTKSRHALDGVGLALYGHTQLSARLAAPNHHRRAS